MKRSPFISKCFGLALCVSLAVPHLAHASGRGLFKDMYCAVLSLVNRECEPEIEGVKVKIRADATEVPAPLADSSAAVPEKPLLAQAQTIIERIVEQPLQTIVQGITSEYLEQRLATLAAQLRMEMTAKTVTVRSSSRPDSISSKQIDSIYESIGDATDGLQTEAQVLALITANAGGGSESPWAESGSDIYFDAGNVGIGTDSPTATLDVVGGMQITGGIVSQDAIYAPLFGGPAFSANELGLQFFMSGANGSLGMSLDTTEDEEKIEFSFDDGSSDALTILRSGNVGIGTTDPLSQLHISGSSGVVQATIESLSDYATLALLGVGNEDYYGDITFANTDFNDIWHIQHRQDVRSLRFSSNDGTSNVNVLELTAEGNVGIGTADPVARLNVVGQTDNYAKIMESSGTFDSVEFQSLDNGEDDFGGSSFNLSAEEGVSFFTHSSDFADITAFSVANAGQGFNIEHRGTYVLHAGPSSSNLGVGTTDPQRQLHVAVTTDTPPVRFQDSSGYCEINPTSTTWTCTSDERLKHNIESIDSTDILGRLEQIRPVTFAWNSDDSDRERIGLIAQEVEAIFPDLVSTDSETGMKSVSYGGFTTYLISAVKELAARVAALAERVQTDELCVGNTCVTEAQLIKLLDSQNVEPSSSGNDEVEEGSDESETESFAEESGGEEGDGTTPVEDVVVEDAEVPSEESVIEPELQPSEAADDSSDEAESVDDSSSDAGDTGDSSDASGGESSESSAESI